MGIWLAGLVAMGLGAGEARPCGAELFRDVRSTNTNVVLYQVSLVGVERTTGTEVRERLLASG